MYGFHKTRLDKYPCNSIYQKIGHTCTGTTANDLIKMLNTHFKLNIQNFFTLQHFCQPNNLPNGPTSLPAVRPGSTMARAPVFSHNEGNLVGFTKVLF